MRKVNKFVFVNILIYSLLVVSLVLFYFFPVVIEFENMWKILVILFICIALYYKYFMYKSESNLWFAITLSLVDIYLFLFYYFELQKFTLVWLTLAPIIASGVIALLKDQLLHKCLFILLAFNLLPMFLYSYGIFGFWVTGAVQLVSGLVGLVVVNLLFFKR